jgi:hypothetical protein
MMMRGEKLKKFNWMILRETYLMEDIYKFTDLG